jgi:hypothetical protein
MILISSFSGIFSKLEIDSCEIRVRVILVYQTSFTNFGHLCGAKKLRTKLLAVTAVKQKPKLSLPFLP